MTADEHIDRALSSIQNDGDFVDPSDLLSGVRDGLATVKHSPELLEMEMGRINSDRLFIDLHGFWYEAAKDVMRACRILRDARD